MPRPRKALPAELRPAIPGKPVNLLPDKYRRNPLQFAREEIDIARNKGEVPDNDAAFQTQIIEEDERRWRSRELPAIAGYVNRMYARGTFVDPDDFMIVWGLWNQHTHSFRLSHGDPAVTNVLTAHNQGMARPITDAFRPIHEKAVPVPLALLAFEKREMGEDVPAGVETSVYVYVCMPANLEASVKDGNFTDDVSVGDTQVYTTDRQAVHRRKEGNFLFRPNSVSKHPRKRFVAFHPVTKKPIYLAVIPQRFLRRGKEGEEGFQPGQPCPVDMDEFADGYQAQVMDEGAVATDEPAEEEVKKILDRIAHGGAGGRKASRQGEFDFDGRVWNALSILGIKEGEAPTAESIGKARRRYSPRLFDARSAMGLHSALVLLGMPESDRTAYMKDKHFEIFKAAVGVAEGMLPKAEPVEETEGDKPADSPPATSEASSATTSPADTTDDPAMSQPAATRKAPRVEPGTDD
ncbi:hypothetical protein HYW18_03005 [Candidatus Uhrbacteria bacterium]|nr:hypothetical protein [Candidatus Uhrbacteria bacterium]